MRRFPILLIVITALVGVLGSSVFAGAKGITSPIPCRATTDDAEGFRSYIIRVTMTQDSAQARLRTSFELPLITDSAEVAFVTDTTICTQAATANALAGGRTTTPAADVHVLRVGPTRYITFNYQQEREYSLSHVFDQNFNWLATLTS